MQWCVWDGLPDDEAWVPCALGGASTVEEAMDDAKAAVEGYREKHPDRTVELVGVVVDRDQPKA